MKTANKIKTEKAPPKAKAVKGVRRSARKTASSNGKHPPTTYEHAPIGIVEASLDGKHINVNEEFCRIVGYEKEELIGHTLKDFTHEEDYAIDVKLHEQLVAGKIPFYRFEKRYLRKDGSDIWVELTRSIVRDEEGNPLYTIGVVLDISERKHVERVLRDSVERLRLATEAAQMFTWEWDFQNNSYTLSDSFTQVLGFSTDLLSKNSFETLDRFLPAEDLHAAAEAFQKAVENQKDLHSLQCRVINSENGQIIWLEVSAKIVYGYEGRPERMFGVAQNITENKEAEEAVQHARRQAEQSADRTAQLQKVTAALSETLTPSQVAEVLASQGAPAFGAVSSSMMMLSEDGQTLEIIYSTSAESLIRPYKRFSVSLQVPSADAVRTSQPVWIASRQQYLERYPHLAEQIDLWGHQAAIAIPMVYKERILGVLTLSFERELAYSLKDWEYALTLARQGAQALERARAENALRESEERFRALVSQATAGIAQSDPDSRLTFINPRFCEMLGYSESELLGKTIWELTYTEDLEENKRLFERMLEQGESYHFEKRFIRKDGSTLWTNVSVSTIRDLAGKPKGGVGVIVDIQESKQAETALTEYARQQEALYKLSDQLHRTASLEDVFNAALDAILSALQCDRASILLYDDMNVMRFVAWRGLSDSYRKAIEGHSPWSPDTKDPEPISISDIRPSDFSDSLKAVIEGEGIGSLAFIPLISKGKLIGKFMVYFNTPHDFDEGELDLSLTIGRQLATGIDRKRAEEALRIENERFMRFVNSNIVGILIGNPRGEVILANDYYLRLLGVSRQEFNEGKVDWKKFTPPEWLPADEKAIQELREHGVCEPYEKEYIRADGSRVPVYIADALLPGPGEEIAAFVIDITERKRAEEQLRRSAEFDAFRVTLMDTLRPLSDPQKILAESMRVLGEKLQVDRVLYSEIQDDDETILIIDNYVKDGVPKLTGRASLHDYGKARGLLSSGKNLIIMNSTTSPDMDEKDRASFAALGIRSGLGIPLIKGGRWVATLGVHHSAPRTWTENEIKFMEETAERTWSALERARAQEALRKSEERYRFIVENTSDGIWSIELTEPMPISLPEEEQIDWYYDHAVIRQCNLGFARMYGFDSVEEVIGLPMQVVMPRENPLNLELSRKFISSGYRLVDSESRETDKDGHELVFINNMIGIVEDGKLKGEWGTNRDITERKRAEEALRRNEQMFSRLVDAAPFGVYFIDSEFRLRAINKGSQAVFSGIDPLIGRDFAEVLRIVWKEPFATEAIERFRHTLRTGESFISQPAIEERANIEEIQAYDWQVHRITLSDGTYGVVCYFYDLSEQKRMEATVRASEALYRTIARSIPGGGVYVVDKDFRYLVAEGPVTEAFGLSREMLEGHTISEVFPDERGAKMEDRLRRNFAGETVGFETELNGRVYWTQQAPLQDSIGQAIILTLDITERKRAEEALRQSEERFAQFMQHLPGLAWIKDMQGRYVYANAAAEQAFNTPREKLYGKTDEEIFPAEVATQYRRNDAQALDEEKGVQVIETLEHEDGILHSSLVSKFPIPGPDGSPILIGGTAFDITERLQAEEALRESEERFSAILRQATAGIVRKDAEGRLVFVNQAFCNMLGYTEEELVGETIWELMHPEDVMENRQSYNRLMAEGIPFKLERRLLREDGSVIWVDASVSPIMDATGKSQSAVAVEVDITGRKQAEEALRELNLQLEDRVLSRTAKLRAVNQTLREEIAERKRIEEALRQSEFAARTNEEKLRTLFDLLPVGISFLSPEGQIIQMNSALPKILKLSKEELLNQAYKSRKYIRADGRLMSPVEFASARALAEGRTIHNVETGILLEDGEVIWTNVSAAPVNVADVGAVVVTVDITDSKRAERALQESHRRLRILSQRLVEVQEDERRALARELHDRVGQTLAALNINLIIINSQLSGEAAEQIGSRLNDSMKLVAETIALVRDVMTDLRPSVLDDYGLEAALESHLAQFISRYNISTKLEKRHQPLPRLGPSIEMTFLRIAQEALMNIARHAKATQVKLSLWQEENRVHLSIQDNGIGIESWQDANRPGSHGLTIMRERAEAFDGNLKVSSVPGQGTVVEVIIPFTSDGKNQSREQKDL